MASGGRKPGEGADDLRKAETDTEQGRGGQENIRECFQGGSSTGAAVWGGDVGVDPRIEWALDSFMHGAARPITGRQPWRGWDRKCYYPSLEGAMKEMGLRKSGSRSLIGRTRSRSTLQRDRLRKAETDTEQGRGGQENIGKFFQGGSSTGAAVWGGDVGVESKNREGVGLIHAWGRATDHGETAVERVG